MDARAKAKAARDARLQLLQTSGPSRSHALQAMAEGLEAHREAILFANRQDLEAAEGLTPALRQRLVLDADKLATAVEGVRVLANMPDPVGRTRMATKLDEGLELFQETVPIGVIACIFESRPDVCIQIPALCIRTGNAVLLKGGKEAEHTNQAIWVAIQEALAAASMPVDAVQLLQGRSEVAQLLELEGIVDLIIPRGGNALVRHIQENTHIPVLGHAAGVCHIYVDASADLDKAARIILDAKMDAPSACNAVETVLVHEDHEAWWARLQRELVTEGIQVAADGFGTEYSALQLNHRMVADLDDALRHIETYGSGHTDAIITENPETARRFTQAVDSASVFVNASTRFADGFRYGLGAEVGISTGKIHARGPVGVEGLLSTRWILLGHGQTAGDFKTRAYIHESLNRNLQEAQATWPKK